MKKHGAYWETDSHGFTFFWMGEEVKVEDFNERLMNQFKSASKDLDWMLKGMELKENINEGKKTVAQLDELEKVARLPLCKDCRKLVGEMPQ